MPTRVHSVGIVKLGLGGVRQKPLQRGNSGRVSPAEVVHLRVGGAWVSANPMDSKVEPVRISAMSLGVSGSTDPVHCGARPLRAYRDERGRGTVVGQ